MRGISNLIGQAPLVGIAVSHLPTGTLTVVRNVSGTQPKLRAETPDVFLLPSARPHSECRDELVGYAAG
jgi:hypothetical protein